MTLVDKVNNDLKEAMKARQEARLRALRNIKSAFLLLATAEGAAEVTDEMCLKALQKLAKQRKDSLDIYIAQNRPDLATKEQEELDVINTYLPAQMSTDEVKSIVKALIDETGLNTPKDMGKLMPMAMQKLAGNADGKTISAVLKELLG